MQDAIHVGIRFQDAAIALLHYGGDPGSGETQLQLPEDGLRHDQVAHRIQSNDENIRWRLLSLGSTAWKSQATNPDPERNEADAVLAQSPP